MFIHTFAFYINYPAARTELETKQRYTQEYRAAYSI